MCDTLDISSPSKSVCFNISSFPKSRPFPRKISMLSFTVAVCPNFFMTSRIHYWTIPPTRTLSTATQLALANGILANVVHKRRLGRGYALEFTLSGCSLEVSYQLVKKPGQAYWRMNMGSRYKPLQLRLH